MFRKQMLVGCSDTMGQRMEWSNTYSTAAWVERTFCNFYFLFLRRGSGVWRGRESCVLMMKEGGRKEKRSVPGNILSDEAVIRSYRWAGYLISYLTRGA